MVQAQTQIIFGLVLFLSQAKLFGLHWCGEVRLLLQVGGEWRGVALWEACNEVACVGLNLGDKQCSGMTSKVWHGLWWSGEGLNGTTGCAAGEGTIWRSVWAVFLRKACLYIYVNVIYIDAIVTLNLLGLLKNTKSVCLSVNNHPS